MANEKFTIITAVHLLLVRNDNSLLLSRRYNTGYEDGNYSVIAGHVEKDETVREAMQREALEEAGISINITDLEFIHVMYRRRENTADLERVDFFFKSSIWQGTPKIMERNKCDEMKWFAQDEIPINTIGYIKRAIKEYSLGEKFSEYGWE